MQRSSSDFQGLVRVKKKKQENEDRVPRVWILSERNVTRLAMKPFVVADLAMMLQPVVVAFAKSKSSWSDRGLNPKVCFLNGKPSPKISLLWAALLFQKCMSVQRKPKKMTSLYWKDVLIFCPWFSRENGFLKFEKCKVLYRFFFTLKEDKIRKCPVIEPLPFGHRTLS